MGLEFKTTLLVLCVGILAYNKLVISPSSSESDSNNSLSNYVCNVSKLRAKTKCTKVLPNVIATFLHFLHVSQLHMAQRQTGTTKL